MSLLEIVDDACDQIQGVARPIEVAGSPDPGVQQMQRLLNAGGKILAREHDWSALVKIRTFTGVAAQAQTGEPPAAYDRFVGGGRIYDGSGWALNGAKGQDAFLASAVDIPAPYRPRWALVGGVLNITPAPAITDSFTYGYITRNWVRPAGATDDLTDKAAFTLDTDTSLIPEELLTLDLIWRWKHAKGLEYAEDMATFERQKQVAQARDRGPHMVPFSAGYSRWPDNYWNETIG